MGKYLSILIISLMLLSCQNKGSNTKIKPRISNITESIYASIKIKPEVSYFPQSTRAGIIEKINIVEGDQVKEGDVLFQVLPSNVVNNQLANARINLKEAKSNYLGQNSLLNNIQLEIQRMKEQATLDSINYQRQKRLYAQDLGTKVDYDLLRLKYSSTKNQLGILRQKLVQTKMNLESNYQKALNQVNTEKKGLSDFKITSKINGKVYSVNKEVGDFIGVQEPFAEIGSEGNFKIEMDVDEVDITKVEIGDTVLILLDAYGNDVYLATVAKIFPKKDELSQTFYVESQFIEQPPKLYYGLAGEANIVVSKRKNSLVIPTDYLLDKNRVLTTDGERRVKVGMKNLEFVEVLSGIDTSVSLIKPTE